jgi:hypothetical protein
MDRKNFVSGFFWFWVIAGMAVYLYQFRGFVLPILHHLGIA